MKNTRLARGRRGAARMVQRALREKQRRDEANEELAAIKREAVEEAKQAGRSQITKIHPRTGQRITVYRTRAGSPIDADQIDDIAAALPDELGDVLFPITTQRVADWHAVQEFMTAEHRTGSPEARAAERIAGAVDNTASWGMKISDPKPNRCLECGEEVSELEPLRLCPIHKRWYKTAAIMLKLSKPDPDIDLRKFNDARRTRYRARFLTKEGLRGWEEKRCQNRAN